jgi:signal peptidase II
MAQAAGASGDNVEDGAATSTAGPKAGATTGRPLWVTFIGLSLTVFVLDQLTKAWIAANVEPGRPVEVLGDFVRLVITHNTGALFGLFRDQAPLFALASIAVIGLIVAYHGRSGRSPLLSVALGLLLGGALGNLADRLRLGYVLDFVDSGIGDFRWYTFNVADAAISGSLVLILLLALFPSLGDLGTDRRRRRGPDA